MIYALLFILGFIEEFVAIVYYGFIRKGWKIPISLISMFRNVIWWIAIIIGALTSLFEYNTFNASIGSISLKVLCHTLGVGLGSLLSAGLELKIHKQILKLTKGRGKKKRWWFLAGARK